MSFSKSGLPGNKTNLFIVFYFIRKKLINVELKIKMYHEKRVSRICVAQLHGFAADS